LQLRVLVAQAHSLYASGATIKADEVLTEMDWHALHGYDRLEALVLLLDVRADLLRLDGPSREEALQHARRWQDAAVQRDAALAGSGVAWVRARSAYHDGDRNEFALAHDETVAGLRPLAFTADPQAVKAFCRFSIQAAQAWMDFGDASEAARALRDAQSLLTMRSDLPSALFAELHAQRACAYACDPATFGRWRAERDAAVALAFEHALVRSAWLCHYLDIAVAFARDERKRAHDGARSLAESARASDSAAWQRVAEQLLARAQGTLAIDATQNVPFDIARYTTMLAKIAQATVAPLESVAIAAPLPALTARQREIATLAANGISNREIATRLGISHRTVENHLNAIFTRYEIRSRWQLAERLKAEAEAAASGGGAVNRTTPDGA
jgi:DNA-binding CsgD family transcriptional regulator